MAAEKKFTVIIAGDDRTGGAFKSVDDGASKLGSTFKKVAIAAGAAFAADRIISFGADLLKLGTTVATWRAKTATVFGNQAADVRAWADKTNEALGITDDELAGLAASFGDLLVPMGFSRQAAADMSKKTIELSGALSAWSGGQRTAAEVSQILAKAMLGERDELKSLGISISEADVQQRILEKGQKDLTGAAREQAEAIATQELIIGKSTDAQAAWADGTFDNIQKQNELKAKMKELKEDLAEKLLPVFEAVTRFIVEKFIPAIERLGEKAGDMKDDFLRHLKTIVDGFLASGEWIAKAEEKMFGWIPGWGDKFHRGAQDVEEFRDRVNAAFDSIINPDITVRIRAKYETPELMDKWGPSGPHNAAGTGNWRGGLTWVGERGPELLNVPSGSSIGPNHDPGRYLAGSTFNLTVNAGMGADGNQIGSQIVDAISEWERRNGTSWRN